LTRGDLYQSWEKGQEVFEEYLLDADWSLNAANWQWLSASAFFHQYWKCYSPIEFGKKTDKEGLFIKKYLPVFKDFPSKYIYEPWMATPVVQKSAKCVIGVDYPKPIVDHKIDGKLCMERMKQAFSEIKQDKDVKPTVAVSDKPRTSKTDYEIIKPVVKSEPATPNQSKKTTNKRPKKEEEILPMPPSSKKAKIEHFFIKKTS